MTLLTGNDLVNKFRSFGDVPYQWGGASQVLGWDCSGAINNIVGWQFHLAIPAHNPGGFNPAFEHGPVVADWISWIGVTRGNFPDVTPQPGDLIAWGPNTHMGMAVSATRLRSAENPNAGTREDDIAGFFSFNPFVLRLLQVTIGTSLPSIPRAPGPGGDDYSPTIRNTALHITEAGRKSLSTAAAIRSLRR